MSKKLPDDGFQRFDFRHGLTAKPAKGMQRTKDPGSTPIDQFYYLQNVRISGDGIEERGGLEKFANTPMIGCVVGIIDDGFDQDGGESLLYDLTGNVKRIDTNDQIEDIGMVGGIASEARIFGYIGDVVLVGHVSNPMGNPEANVSTDLGSLLDPPHEDEAPVWAYVRDGANLVFATKHGNVYTWDGITISTENTSDAFTRIGNGLGVTSGVQIYSRLGAVGGELFYASGDSPLQIYTGSGTSWTEIANPGGFTLIEPTDLIGYRGDLYVTAFDNASPSPELARILKYDLSAQTYAVVRNLSGTRAHCGAVLGGIFYYIWSDDAGDLWLGSYNGVSWEDSVKNISSDFPSTNGVNATRLVAFNGGLWLGTRGSGTSKLLRSPDSITGTWTALDSSTSALQDMVVVKWIPQLVDA